MSMHSCWEWKGSEGNKRADRFCMEGIRDGDRYAGEREVIEKWIGAAARKWERGWVEKKWNSCETGGGGSVIGGWSQSVERDTSQSALGGAPDGSWQVWRILPEVQTFREVGECVCEEEIEDVEHAMCVCEDERRVQLREEIVSLGGGLPSSFETGPTGGLGGSSEMSNRHGGAAGTPASEGRQVPGWPGAPGAAVLKGNRREQRKGTM